jgi:hypothetical protein
MQLEKRGYSSNNRHNHEAEKPVIMELARSTLHGELSFVVRLILPLYPSHPMAAKSSSLWKFLTDVKTEFPSV